MPYLFLALSILATIFVTWKWSQAVSAGSGEGAEASVQRGLWAGFWGATLMVVAFLTLQFFARFLAVWTHWASKPY